MVATLSYHAFRIRPRKDRNVDACAGRYEFRPRAVCQSKFNTISARHSHRARLLGLRKQEQHEDKNDVTVRNFGKPLPKASEPVVGTLTLVVRASENSWISVVADGQVVAEETLIAPANNTFHASNGFVVKVGNAAAVSFLINGKEVAPQGTESEVKTLTFDSSGLKSAP